MTHKTKEEVRQLFTSAEKSHFKKSGRFLSREARIGETILTIVAGKLETIKKIEKPSIILRNIQIGSSAEVYAIDLEVFRKRYSILEENHSIDNFVWNVAIAKGEVDAFEYTGEPFVLIAPWNEEMLCENGDYIARPIGGNEDDIYRIEKDTFKQTYSLAI